MDENKSSTSSKLSFRPIRPQNPRIYPDARRQFYQIAAITHCKHKAKKQKLQIFFYTFLKAPKGLIFHTVSISCAYE